MSNEVFYPMTRYEALSHDLALFGLLEDVEQECVAHYIECPSVDECDYDGIDETKCTACKIKWLKGEWEE